MAGRTRESVTDARALFEALTPDANARANTMIALASTVRYVRRRRREGAIIHVDGRKVRILVGRLIVMTMEGGRVWLTTDASLTSDWAKDLVSWEWDSGQWAVYRRRPESRNGFYDPRLGTDAEWSLISAAHEKHLDAIIDGGYIDDARSWARNETAIVDFLEHWAGPEVHEGSITEEHWVDTDADVMGARTRALVEIVRRDGRAAFRARLLDAYGRRCAITGCPVADLLDAAHIRPFSSGGSDEVRNGLLLRTDLHRLFDLGLLAIDPITMTIAVAPCLSATDYGRLAGAPIARPENARHGPSPSALAARLKAVRALWGADYSLDERRHPLSSDRAAARGE